MPRRVSLPAAEDLFRPTTGEAAAPERTGPARRVAPAEPAGEARDNVRSLPRPARPSGRVRHDEKMTVYVTSEELLALEHARLALRSTHGLAVDRGRLVREAIALALADLEEHGESSDLVRRLAEG